MADETSAVADAGAESTGGKGSLRTALIGSSIVLWILAFYVINALNGVRSELQEIRADLGNLVSMSSGQHLGGYQVVDKDGVVIYTFQQVPVADEMTMMACPMSASEGAAPAGE